MHLPGPDYQSLSDRGANHCCLEDSYHQLVESNHLDVLPDWHIGHDRQITNSSHLQMK